MDAQVMRAGWALVAWSVVTAMAAVLHGCCGRSDGNPVEPPPPEQQWFFQSYREQYAGVPDGCVTVWVEPDSPGCAVACDDMRPVRCVATKDPLIARTDPTKFCKLGSTSRQTCDCSGHE